MFREILDVSGQHAMLLCISICILQVMQVLINGYVIGDSHNIMVKDTAHYKVDEPLKEQDYEMISGGQVIEYGLNHRKNKLVELNKLARKEYFKSTVRDPESVNRKWFGGTEPLLEAVANMNDYVVTNSIQYLTRNSSNKGQVSIRHEDNEYNYDYLLKEYYEETTKEGRSNAASYATKNVLYSSLKKTITFDAKAGNCTVEETKNIGFKAIYCLFRDYISHRQSTKVLAARLWRIVKIWFIVYLIIALPLWCTRGWCCCCLFCKFFKPKLTIAEAKTYLLTNPPGKFKLEKSKETLYAPTDREKEAYEELDHLIRTI